VRKLILTAIAAIFSFSAQAQAQTGWDFYQRCGTGAEAGFLNRDFCHAYVAGFYDALAATGRVCTSVPPNDTQLVMVVQNWLRGHAAVLNQHPAHFMIRNAIMSSWGCQTR